MGIPVSQAVLDGIKAVRDNGQVNMLSRDEVARLCSEMRFFDAAAWIVENKRLYAEGVFKGFVADEAAGAQEDSANG